MSLKQVDGYLSSILLGDATGSFSPAITKEPSEGEKTPISIDACGNIAIRGQTLTDEYSFRDDFIGDSLGEDWEISLSGNSSYSVADSYVSLYSGTTSGSYIRLSRVCDYSPFYCYVQAKVSQRIENQRILIGFGNDANPVPHLERAYLIITGTNNRCLKFKTESGPGSYEETEITLPFGWTTDDSLLYQIEINTNYCSFSVHDAILAVHKKHIPSVYTDLKFAAYIQNTGTPVSETNIDIDMIHYENHNQLQITSGFLGEPLPVRITEDVHTINSCLTTCDGYSDQIIMQYAVPNERVLYILGWRLTVSGSGAAASPFKIGRNDISGEPYSPGKVDSNIFRILYMSDHNDISEDYSACPRLLGKQGDIIKATVTPSDSTITTWRFYMDIVLR